MAVEALSWVPGFTGQLAVLEEFFTFYVESLQTLLRDVSGCREKAP